MTPADKPALPAVGDGSFDEFYYRNCCGKPYDRNDEWFAFFGRIADRIVEDLKPARVLDAGCALGLLVETLRARGVDAYGVDLSSYAIERVDPSMRPYCRRGSITEPLDGDYDLIVTVEVVEHIPAAEAERAIQNLCAHSRRVLFSSSPFDYREPTHVNVHPVEYWAEQFARWGFYRDVDYDASFLTEWAVLFRRSDDPVHRVVRHYERRFRELQAADSGSRNYAVELQARLAHAERQLADADAARLRSDAALARERDELTRERDERSLERTNMKAGLDYLQAQVQAQGEQVAAAQAAIQAMRRSPFWRMRQALVRLRRMIGSDVS